MLNKLLGNSSKADSASVQQEIGRFLVQGENVEGAYRVYRDLMVFTNKRLLILDKQGMTGSKVQVISIPYKSIKSFSIENTGTFDLDSELKIWLTGSEIPMTKAFSKGDTIYEVQVMLVRHTC